ncbi:MAG: phosphoribosylanthranilate isomerase [Acidobacteria bacterium]|nr:phosphoribosylanthranilate isomerase [Acidobacteriota bacterium]
MRTRFKICCMGSVEEAALAVAVGADAVGLVGAMPSGPGPIPDELAREIAASVPPPVATFLLTSRTRARDIADHVAYCGVTTVQVVQHIEPAEAEELARLLPPSVRRVQVLHVEGPAAVELAAAYRPFVHAFLLDSGRPSLAVPELGGTGRVHDWAVSRELVRSAGRPVFLAGGLKAENAAEAIRTVRPYGLDVCSGVRTEGRLDPAKLEGFAAAVRG